MPRAKHPKHKTGSSSAIDELEQMASEPAEALPSMRVQAQRRAQRTQQRPQTTPDVSSSPDDTASPVDTSTHVSDETPGLHPLVHTQPDARARALEVARLHAKQQRKHERNERTRQAWELRKAGASFPSIAQQCGFKSPSAASSAVKRYASRAAKEEAYELKMLQMDRLNHMLLVLWPQVQAGSTSAINASLAIWDRIQRAEHLDGPIEMKVQHAGLPDQNVLVIGGDTEAYKKALAQLAGRTDVVEAIDAQVLPSSSTSTDDDTGSRSPDLLEQSEPGPWGAAPQTGNTGDSGEPSNQGVVVHEHARSALGDEIVDVMERLAAGASLAEPSGTERGGE